ncbi:MAG: ABC transporter ATP-binding protein [Dehalococcoidia bacterium]|nr:ABC transporter ATP-binding protein [Dehalococcoidia bacterium]
MVGQGEVFGFLGPNGSGKSTTIHLLMGFLQPTRGAAQVLGKDPWSHGPLVRAEIGFVPDSPALYETFTGQELLDFLGTLQGRPPALRSRILELLELSKRDLERPIRGYSRGMRQKIALAQAFQHDPQLLILDEPTEGLDPLMQQAVFTLLREQHERGHTIFMSSHILPDVERLCERVGVVRAGRLVLVAGMEELRGKQVRHMRVVLGREGLPNPFAGLPGVLSAQRNGQAWHLQVQGDVNPLLRVLAQMDVRDLVYEPAHLEDAFLELYGGKGPAPQG